MNVWQTSRRKLALDHTLVMAILNVTPDSFSDGGKFAEPDTAVREAERYVEEGANIIDIGGESTRPGSKAVSVDEELSRVLPAIEAIARRVDIPLSIDTTKSVVAREATAAGAEIINDISGLRFDPAIARVAAETGAGLILMHSRGSFETMHNEPPVDDVMADVADGFKASIDIALEAGVGGGQLPLDPGIGFGKTFEQNLELLANLDKICSKFPRFPMLVGTSRKSFLGKLLSGVSVDERRAASVAGAVAAIIGGAKIVRVHDVKETVEAVKVIDALNKRRI